MLPRQVVALEGASGFDDPPIGRQKDVCSYAIGERSIDRRREKGKMGEKMDKKLQITIARKGWGLRGVYVGRPTPLGNPFRLKGEEQREEVVARYATWLEEELRQGNREVARALGKLYRKLKRQGTLTLLCFCAPKRCHAEVIAERLKLMAEAEGLKVEVSVAGR